MKWESVAIEIFKDLELLQQESLDILTKIAEKQPKLLVEVIRNADNKLSLTQLIKNGKNEHARILHGINNHCNTKESKEIIDGIAKIIRLYKRGIV